MIRRLGGGFLLSEELDTLLGLHMELGVDPLALRIDELHCVARVAVHEAVAVRNATVAHEDHDLVDGLGILGEVVPEHGAVIGAGEMGGRVTLLRVDEVGELGGVAKEEDGRVVGHHVPIALISPELDREAARVPSAVVGAGLAADGGEADGDGAHLAGFEDVGAAQVIEGVRGPVVSVSAATLGVDNALGDTFAVKVREQVDEVEVLQEQRTVLTRPL